MEAACFVLLGVSLHLVGFLQVFNRTRSEVLDERLVARAGVLRSSALVAPAENRIWRHCLVMAANGRDARTSGGREGRAEARDAVYAGADTSANERRPRPPRRMGGRLERGVRGQRRIALHEE